MTLKIVPVFTAIAVALLAFTSRAQAAPLLAGNTNNQLNFSDVENLYSSTGKYIPGNTPPKAGEFLVGIFEITANLSNGWSPNNSTTAGVRDTYYGAFVEKISGVSTTLGVTTIGLTPAAPGDPTTFTGGGKPGDTTSFSTVGVLNYNNGDQFALYHQSGSNPPQLFYGTTSTVTPASEFPAATVGAEWAVATEGSLFLTANSNGAINPTANQGANGNYYSFSKGTVPPGTFALTNFSGTYIDVNNTGFTSFDQISDPNPAAGVGGGPPVSFYLESKVNFNVNAKYNAVTNKFAASRTSSWDFQSADPANIEPAVVPAPASLILFALGGIILLPFVWLRRFKQLGYAS